MAVLGDVVAAPMMAPQAWQVGAPDDVFQRGMPVLRTADLERVLALPRRQPLDLDSPLAQAVVELEMRKYALPPRERCECRTVDPRRKSCVTRFIPAQAWMLREITMARGLLASAAPGLGKTLVGLLAPLAMPGCRVALMLVPATAIKQIVRDYKLTREHFRVPSIIVHNDRAQPWRCMSSDPGAPRLEVLSYNRLQMPDASDWIRNHCDPDLIIADEVDSLKDLTASRTMRVMRSFSGEDDMTPEERRHCNARRFCGWTGTLTNSKIAEFAHLALLALRERSPMPLVSRTAREWGQCLDAVPNPCPPGALLDLCDPGEDVRVAFGRRLAETLGFIMIKSNPVVTAEGERVQASVRERQAPPIPPRVALALDMVRKFLRPDTLAGNEHDEELVDAMSQAKCAHEVAAGFFYRWIFPRGESEELKDEWFAARKLFNKELRLKIMQGETYLDSKMLCEHAAMRAWGDLPSDPKRPDWKSEHWSRWRDVMDLVEPQTQAVFLDDYLARDAAEWGLKNRGIIWYGAIEFAQMVRRLSDLPVHGGGVRAEQLLLAERGDRSIIASLKSHGRARDGLQRVFHQQLVAQTPASATIWAQLLGRLVRRDQEQSEVLTEVYLHTPELRRSFDQAMRSGEYVQQVMRSEQLLLEGFRE